MSHIIRARPVPEVEYTTDPLVALHKLMPSAIAKTMTLQEVVMHYTALWGQQAHFQHDYVGGRGYVPVVTNRNGLGVMLCAVAIPGQKGMRYREAE